MASQSRCFPYEKNIVINALYDTIDTLGLCLESSNSARGTLIVTDTNHTEKMRVALNFDVIKGQTHVDIFSESIGTNISETWSTVILDELSGRIKCLHQLVLRSSNGLFGNGY